MARLSSLPAPDFSTLHTQHIRKSALQHLHQEITITRKQGSFTLEESLAELVRRGVLTPEEARNRTVHQEEVDSLLR